MGIKGVEGVKLAIVGGRDFGNRSIFNKAMDPYIGKVGLVVSGAAPGADTFGEDWADICKAPKLIFPADWDKHGKKAGFLRNRFIVENCNACIAFWDGKSKGTKSTIDLCEYYNIPVKIVYY